MYKEGKIGKFARSIAVFGKSSLSRSAQSPLMNLNIICENSFSFSRWYQLFTLMYMFRRWGNGWHSFVSAEYYSSKHYRSTGTNFEGFGICSSVYPANVSFFVSERVNCWLSLFCNKRWERFTPSRSFLKSNESESLLGIISGKKSEKMSKSCEK